MAAEQAAVERGRLPDGVESRQVRWGSVRVHRVRIQSDRAAHLMGKPKGSYYTVEGRAFTHSVDDREEQSRAAARLLKSLLPAHGAVLVVGLGNRELTPDALGPLTTDRVLVTRHLQKPVRLAARLRETAVLAPGVLPQTGVEAGEIIRWAVEQLHPAAVVAVDALAARETHRLGRTIQICDAGIVPGSGVSGSRKALSRRTLGVPVVGIGVPTVMDAATFAADMGGRAEGEELPLAVTSHDIDLGVQRSAACLALAINMALQTDLSLTELRALSG